MTYKGEAAEERIAEHARKIEWALEELGEPDLRGLVTAARKRAGGDDGDQADPLWRGVAGLVEHELAVRKARRTRGGTWYASVTALSPDGAARHLYRGEMLEHRACKGRDAAVAAGRELLRKHADRFTHEVRLEVEVVPEIEWGGAPGDEAEGPGAPR